MNLGRAATHVLLGVSLLIGNLGCDGQRASTKVDSPPLCGENPIATAIFRSMCDYLLLRMNDVEEIFIGGYAMRTLVAGHAILGDSRYLEAAIAYADRLLASQSERGYWTTGYSNSIYLADTGSALGLLMVLYPHVDAERKQLYLDAISRYVQAIEADSLVLPSGAIGTGWRVRPGSGELESYRDPYTISSALTGSQVFVWMFHQTREERYRKVAVNALRWILSTMREDGVIPYILAGEGGDPERQDDPSSRQIMWEKWRYDTSAYVGEGVIAFDRYCDKPEWREEIRAAVAPHIEFLLDSQNDDGSWAVPGSRDQKRSPGVVNFLVWYHTHVSADPRIPRAVCGFQSFLQDRVNARALGLLIAGAEATREAEIVTAITGRALADLLRPGVDAAWEASQ